MKQLRIQKLTLTFLLVFMGVCPAQDSFPDWAKGVVWYQIFPERFRNAIAQNDPIKARSAPHIKGDWQIHPWTSDWYKMQPWEKARGQSFYDVVFDRRYGGDLIGVIEKLDYLKDLGVDVIYFNPIFEARSLHKYDASTYHHIDSNFGPDRDGDWEAISSETEDPATWTFTAADRTFLDLIQKAHDRGIRIVIDGVFNHCGPEFWAFRDVAKNQQKSRYKDWFEVVSWDDPATPDTNEFDYKGWWGYKGLPEFKEDENGLIEPVKEYVFNITRRWMDPNHDGDPSDGIDGWRLDVVQDVHPKFWEEWYRLVKSIKPNAITVGEIWEEASEWVHKKRFDAVMNYPFAKVVVDFFIDEKTKITVSDFDQTLAHLRKVYPDETNHILMNLVDSHDTDRIASMIKNPDRQYDREAGVRATLDYNPVKPGETARQIQKLIAIFQMTYLGAPMIYYGDEAGMWGGDDPDDRKPMIWDNLVYDRETYTAVRPDLKQADEVKFDSDMFLFYQRLIRIRHNNPAIQFGDFRTKLVDDPKGVYAFSRRVAQNEIIVVMNNSSGTKDIEIAISRKNQARVRDLLNAKTYVVKAGKLAITLEGKWGAIMVLDAN